MREDRDTTCPVNERYRFFETELVFRDERRLSVSEKALERLLEVPGVAPFHECARHVRTADGTASRMAQHGVKRHRNPQRVQAFDDALRPVESHVAQTRQPLLELCQFAQVEAKNMSLEISLDSAQLHTADDAQPQSRRRGPGRLESGNGVVVGQRERDQLCRMRGGDDLGRRTRAVGRSRVRVQIHELVLRTSERRITHDE